MPSFPVMHAHFCTSAGSDVRTPNYCRPSPETCKLIPGTTCTSTNIADFENSGNRHTSIADQHKPASNPSHSRLKAGVNTYSLQAQPPTGMPTGYGPGLSPEHSVSNLVPDAKISQISSLAPWYYPGAALTTPTGENSVPENLLDNLQGLVVGDLPRTM